MAPEAAEYVGEQIPACTTTSLSKVGSIGENPEPDGVGHGASSPQAGRADIPVAEEAALTAEALGNRVERLYDVGVAGIHRLLDHAEDIMTARSASSPSRAWRARCRASWAALRTARSSPCRQAWATARPSAALAALLRDAQLLRQRASRVVNIDNGFGAGYLASMINHLGAEK